LRKVGESCTEAGLLAVAAPAPAPAPAFALALAPAEPAAQLPPASSQAANRVSSRGAEKAKRVNGKQDRGKMKSKSSDSGTQALSSGHMPAQAA